MTTSLVAKTYTFFYSGSPFLFFGGYRYGWMVERGKNVSCTRWIDLSEDGDF